MFLLNVLLQLYQVYIKTCMIWKEPRCPSTEEWIQKMWYIYTMECYSAIKSNEFMKFFGKWMELENTS
jgi:predicted metal-binding protein